MTNRRPGTVHSGSQNVGCKGQPPLKSLLSAWGQRHGQSPSAETPGGGGESCGPRLRGLVGKHPLNVYKLVQSCCVDSSQDGW